MEEVKNQAPSDIDEKTLMEVYKKNDNNVLKTLLELWNINDTTDKTSQTDKEKTKWKNIRDTCDDFDKEMYKVMKRR